MRGTIGAVGFVVLAALPLGAQQRQSDASFKWSGRVPSGRWVRVDDLSGSITVGQASGDNVEVTATKQWRRGDPALVRIETRPSSDGGMTICAIWDDRTSCDDRPTARRDLRGNSPSGRENYNNDVTVDFRVLLPRGVKVAVKTLNGSVTVDGATSDVDAATVNGEVDVATTGGRVNASNVNGTVRARLGRIDDDGTMNFHTVNGNVVLELPGDFGGDVDMASMTGSVNSSFEMTLRGRIDPHRLRTHIGAPGGPRLRLDTINGNVELRKR